MTLIFVNQMTLSFVTLNTPNETIKNIVSSNLSQRKKSIILNVIPHSEKRYKTF